MPEDAHAEASPARVATEPGTKSRRQLRSAAGWLIVGSFAFALFARTLQFGLYLDDHHHARPWRFAEVVGTFHGVFDPLGIEPSYFRPLPVVSFALDWQLWGFDTWGYHLTNIMLHTTVCLLVYALFRRLPIPRWTAVAGAMFFAAIPANAATVIYISERSDAMVAAFTLIGLLFLEKYWHRRQWRWLLGVSGCFVLALGSKEVGFGMMLLVAVWWTFLNAFAQPSTSSCEERLGIGAHWRGEAAVLWRSLVGPGRWHEWRVVLGPLVLIGAAYLIYREVVLPTGTLGTPYSSAGPVQGFGSGVYWTLKGVPWEVPGWALPGLVVAGLLALALRPRDSCWRVVLFGLAWIVAAVIPLAPLGQIEPRLLYVAEIGPAIVVAALTTILVRAVRDRATSAAAVRALIVPLTLGLATVVVLATAIATIRAQNEFRPGSSKMLRGDLIVWSDTAKRHLYPQHYIDQIEARLAAAHLIQESDS